jgi:NAD(P)-dependent dehydrogenase (short-subunit alcohol dehydrogenase family)
MNQRTAAVFGAYGHTGRFVVSALHRRGWHLIIAGRDLAKLDAVRTGFPDASIRQASVDDADSLDRAFAGADVAINCAGPFASTAGPVIEAAMRARLPYLDVAAEIEANLDTFANYGERARDAGIVVVPAMAFFGGLGDLLATAALGDWTAADEISIAYGLDSWKPTLGTKAAGAVSYERRNGRRVVYADGALQFAGGTAPRTTWTFPAPLGEQPVIAEFTMADTVTIARHIPVPQIRSYMTVIAVADLVDDRSGPPTPVDGDDERSAQTFLVEVVARLGDVERRVIARGRDIYAISAPLVVEAAERVTRAPLRAGVWPAGALFDARDFLASLAPDLTIAFSTRRASQLPANDTVN